MPDDDQRPDPTPECPEIRTLSEYVDGQLPPSAHRRIDQHLVVCPVCRDDVAELFSVVAMLGGLDDSSGRRSRPMGSG